MSFQYLYPAAELAAIPAVIPTANPLSVRSPAWLSIRLPAPGSTLWYALRPPWSDSADKYNAYFRFYI